MSGTPGHVTRKDGRLQAMPDRVKKIYKWLTIVSFAIPVIMLLVGFGDPKGTLGQWWGMILALLPIGIVMGALVAIMRKGRMGNAFFGVGLIAMHWFAYSVEPYTITMTEMLLTRLTPIVGVAILLSFLKQDLHYNLRPLWYSLGAMQEFQKMMAMGQAKKEAKKLGKDFDESAFMGGASGPGGKTIDVEAAVRAYEQATGQQMPSHMKGMAMKPGFRQEAKKKKADGASGSGKRKRR